MNVTSSETLIQTLSTLNTDSIRTYTNTLDQKGLSQQEIQGKLESVQKFLEWAYYSDKISFTKYQHIKDEIANYGDVIYSKASTEASNVPFSSLEHNSSSNTVKKHPLQALTSISSRPIVFISIALLLLGFGVIGQGIYDRFFSNTKNTLAYATTPVVASRILSFQGRLTDSLGNPITASTNMRFRLYTASSGGTTLYDSGTCSIAPDQDGVHNVLIGSDCGSEIASSVFTENGTVYLGVTVGADSEMTPRQRMANVPYAQNSETLQGLPLGKDASSVPYINNGGDLLISAASPQIGSTYASQAFLISSAQAVTLQSAGAGDVTLTATGSGELKFLVGGATAGVVNNSGNWGIKTSNPSTFELQVNGDVGPETDSAFDLGSNSVRWANVYADNIVGTFTTGFTQGSVTFADGSGNLAQDNAQFFWDDTANKLGIGTAAPLGKFHLTGAATGKAMAILNETGDQNILTASASGTTVANLDRSGNLSVEGTLSDLSGATLDVNDNLDISGTLTSGTANAFTVDATGNISTSATTGLSFTSTGGIVFAGGTLTDSSDGVDINDDLEIAGGTTLGDASGDTVTANAASWTFANDTNFILSGGINGLSLDSTTFSVDATNDRIGIGTAAPDAAWLDIAAATTAKSQLNLTTSAGTNVSSPNSGDLWWNGTNLYFYNGSTNNDLLASGGSVAGSDTQVQYNNGGSFGGASALIYDDVNNRVGIGTATSPTSVFHVAGATIGKALAIFDETGDQNILTASASGTTVANLDRSGNLAIEGSLSDLSGTVLNINDGLSIAGNTTFGDASGDTVTSTAAAWTFASDTTVALSGGVDGINFDSNTLSIDAANNRIGIGTAAPTSMLHVAGGNALIVGADNVNLKIQSVAPSDTASITIAGQNSSTAQNWTLQVPGSSDRIAFKNNWSGIESMSVLATGAVGIVDTSPDAFLDVTGTTTQLRLSYESGDTNYVNFTTSSSGDLAIDATGNDIATPDRTTIGSATAGVGKLNVTGAETGKALTILNETGDQALLTASASGTTRYTLANNGNITYSPSAFGSPITLYDTDTTLPNANTGIVDAINDAYTAAIGGGGGLWTDSGTTTYLTTTTDDIVLGGSSPLSSGKFSIDGDADQIQLIVQGNGTQTSSLAVFEQSDGTDVLTISNAGSLVFAGGTLSDTSDGVDIADDLEISGGTTLGDASGDSVTANAAAWTFANDTTVALSGGLNGLNFDSNTLSIDAAGDKIGIGTAAPVSKIHVTGAVTGKALAIFDETGDQDIIVASGSGSTRFRVANDGTVYGGYFLDISNTAYGIDPAGTSNFGSYSMKITGGALLAADSGNVGIGDQTPDAKLNIQATTEQLRLDYDDSNYMSFTVGSGGDMTLDSTGGDIIIANADVLNIGGSGTDIAYNAIGDSLAGAANVSSDNDLYIEDDLEVDGTIFGSLEGTVDLNFTDGSVLFANSSGVISQDNTNFFWNDTSNRLGLGDTTPDAFLDVTGTTEQLRLSYETGDTNYASFTLGSGGDLTIAPSGGDLAVTGNGDFSGGLNAASGDHFNVDSSGNIGIGTTATTGYGIRMSKTVSTASLSTSYLEHKTVTFTGNPIGSFYYGDVSNLTSNTTTGGAYYINHHQNFTNSSTAWQGYSDTGYWSYQTNNVAANSAYFTGFKADTVNTSTGTAQDYTGFRADVSNGSTGTIAASRNFTSNVTNSAAGTITTAYQYLANSPTNASGTITTIYGLRVDDQSVGTNTTAYGVYIANQAGASGDAIGLYVADADDYSIQLASTDGDAASGITFGTDTNLYRNSANQLHTDDSFDIDGNLITDGNTTLGNASGDTVTANAAAWTFANDTTVALSGGTNGINFDSNTLSIDGTNDRIGIGTAAPAAKIDSLATTEQLRLGYDGSNYSSFTVSSGGDLTIAPTGSDTNITGNLNVSANTGLGDASTDIVTVTGKEIINFDTASADQNGLYINASQNTATAGTLRGLNVGANFWATSGTQTGVNGLDFTVQATGNGGTVTTMKGISAWGTVSTGATVGTFKLVDAANPSNSGTITSLSGYSVDNLTSGSNNTLILAGTSSVPSGNWGIYNTSSYSNYLSGTTGIGTTGPDAKLDVLSTTEQLRLTYTDGSVYSSFTVNSGGDLTLDPTGGDVVADANVNPNTDDTYDLGTDTKRWRDLYLGPDTLHVGTSTSDEGTLKYVTSTNVLTMTNNYGDTDFGSTSDGFNFTLGGAAGDDFIVDSTTFTIESDNDRVGIGMTAPDAAWLDIAAATTGKAQINLTTSAGTDVSAPASGDLWWNGTNLYFYNGSINKDLLAAGGSGPWTDGGSYVYTTAGEVINLGGITGTAYHAISDSGTTSRSLASDDDLFVEGDFEVDTAFFSDGSTTIGDASGDTVTANAAAWTFANDTTVALSGGTDGLNFDSNTLSIDATNDRVGFGTAAPSAKIHALATTEQLRVGYDVSNYASFTTSSGGDLTVDVTGGQFLLADADTLNIGGVSALAYNAISDSGGSTSHSLASDDDLFVEGDVEVNGSLFADGETVLTTVSGAGLSDCDSSTSILLWDSTSKQFSCGKDNDVVVLGTWTKLNVAASLTDSQFDRPQPAYLNSTTSEMSMPYAGNIVGISVGGNAARTAGSATFTVFKNDSTTGFTCVIDGSNTQYKKCTQSSGSDTFSAGDLLDIRVTTDLTFAPTTTEYAVEIWIEMDTGADVAELYNIRDTSIQSGDIVSIDPELKDGVKKSTGSYDASVLGVIATKPGVLLGQHDVLDIGASRAVALTGRVPVKVTTENGPIKIGDSIAASSLPGIGMKSTKASRIVGRALEGWDNADPNAVGSIMMFVEPGYDAGYILTQVHELITEVQKTVVADTYAAKTFIAESIKATSASFSSLIADTFTARKANITDAEIERLNAIAFKAQKIESDEIKTQKITTDTLDSREASISGTLVAETVDAKNITEMRERLERLAASNDTYSVTSEQLNADLEQVQQYIDELTQSPSPKDITDVETYQVSPADITLDAGTTETALGQHVSSVNLESLIVTGTTSMTSLTVADAFSAGNIFIKDNTVVSMGNELKLTALESVDIMNGGVIIAKDGTLTAKGEVIAQKGVRTNTIKSLDDASDVSVVLGNEDTSGTQSSFKVQNINGDEVARIDSRGSADFNNLSLSTYSEATSSAVVIAAGENYRQTGLYAPAIKTNATASGNGILPSGENDIIIFNDSIKKDTIVNLTPTSTTQNRSVYVDKVEACLDEADELCQPYFRVSIDDTISNDVTFNWLLVN